MEGEAKQSATRALIDLLSNLGGKIVAFSHSREELQRVLQGAANYLETSSGRGTIIKEARRRGVTRSDLLLLAESIDDKLSEAGIEMEATPRYIEQFQIDETAFEQVLEDEVSYYNPKAKVYDINSVRSIYVIRANRPAPSVEKARAVFVTSNAAFAKAAWQYGQHHESSQAVSSVISDFSIANLAWLKAPMGALSIPKTQLLALSYAALQPSSALLGKYLTEVDKLETQGKITAHQHQLLRSSPLVYDELMHLTLGDDTSLTEETVTQTLERVSREINKEESKKLTVEQKAHQETRDELLVERTRKQKLISNLYWRCYGKAKVFAQVIWGGVVVLITIGLLSGLGLFSGLGLSLPAPFSWVLTAASTIVTLLTLVNLVFGSTVKEIHAWTQNRYLIWLLKREAKTIGVDLTEFNID